MIVFGFTVVFKPVTCGLTDADVIVVSKEDSGKTFVYVFFLFILKSVLLGGFSLGDRQLYLLHAFTVDSLSMFPAATVHPIG